MKGIGKGFVGTLVKPVDKMGQALSNLSEGFRAEYISRPLGGYRLRTRRRRKPRMLWGEAGTLREYSADDAELRECLGLSHAKNVVKLISVHKRTPNMHMALVIYPQKIYYFDLYAGAHEGATHPARALWHTSISAIKDVRASSQGIIIKADKILQLPCASMRIIREVCMEVSLAMRRSEAAVSLNETLWRHIDQLGLTWTSASE
eukprot:Polyplicarium_translucidae@DN1387_c0_g1_i2.p2